jgi:hypothetical protein
MVVSLSEPGHRGGPPLAGVCELKHALAKAKQRYRKASRQ